MEKKFFFFIRTFISYMSFFFFSSWFSFYVFDHISCQSTDQRCIVMLTATAEHHFMVLLIRFAFVLWLCCSSSSIHATAVGTIVHTPSVRSVSEKDGSLSGILTRLRASGDGIVAKKQEQVRMFRKKKLAFLPDGVKNSLASATATAVVKIILQPLDTIKTIQQARPNIKLGPIKAAAEVIKNRGIVGLWSGIGISILGSSPSGAIYFGVYSSVKTHITKYFSPQYKLVAVAISAAIGNTFASVLRAPYEVLKQRIQTGYNPVDSLSNLTTVSNPNFQSKTS